MIDHTNTQTQQLPLETKRGRGRPKTGTALTPAEKQKAYRERHKGNVTDNSEIEELRDYVKKLREALDYVTQEVITEKLKNNELQKRLEKAYSVTENRDQKAPATAWDVEYCEKGKRTWKRIDGPAFNKRESAEMVLRACEKDAPGSRYRVVEVSLA